MNVDLSDPWIRAELSKTPTGRDALEHYAASEVARQARRPKQARHHRRAAERRAFRVLPEDLVREHRLAR